MSDDALKPAMPLTSFVVSVDRAWYVAPKQPGQSSRLCYSGGTSTDGLSMLTIHDGRPAKESHCHRLGQLSRRLVNRTIGQWHR